MTVHVIPIELVPALITCVVCSRKEMQQIELGLARSMAEHPDMHRNTLCASCAEQLARPEIRERVRDLLP